MATSGSDVLLAAYRALTEAEQDDVFVRIQQLQVERLAGEESDAARFLRSMLRVTEELGHVPSVDEYKELAPQLAAAGEDIEPFTRLYRHYTSWPRAREAVELSGVTTVKRIEARFRMRRLGKVWRYNEDSLRDAMMRAAEHWQRPPSVAEFEWWRERELELAKAAGRESDLPSSSPYRKRWGTWEAALLHFGFTPEQVALRLEGKAVPHNQDPDPYLPTGLPVAELRDPTDVRLPLRPEQARRVVDAYGKLARRSRYVLTVRLGLGVEELTLKAAGLPLSLSLDRVRQLQLHALDALAEAAAGEGRDRPEPGSLRDGVVGTLVRLTVR